MSKKFLAMHEDGTLSLHSELSQDLIMSYHEGYVDIIKIENDTVYRPNFTFYSESLKLNSKTKSAEINWIPMENDVLY